MANPNPSPEQEDEEGWTCFRLKVEGYTLREIEKMTKIPRETVRRRIELIMGQESVPAEMIKATQTARLNYLARRVSDAMEAPESDVAKLAHAGVAVERRMAALHGLDEPSRKAVAVTHDAAEQGQTEPEPWLKKALEDWQQTKIYQDDLIASGGENGEGEVPDLDTSPSDL